MAPRGPRRPRRPSGAAPRPRRPSSPGPAFTPPMSTISAPSATARSTAVERRRPARRSRRGRRTSPGVRLTIAITTSSSSPNVRRPRRSGTAPASHGRSLAVRRWHHRERADPAHVRLRAAARRRAAVPGRVVRVRARRGDGAGAAGGHPGGAAGRPAGRRGRPARAAAVRGAARLPDGRGRLGAGPARRAGRLPGPGDRPAALGAARRTGRRRGAERPAAARQRQRPGAGGARGRGRSGGPAGDARRPDPRRTWRDRAGHAGALARRTAPAVRIAPIRTGTGRIPAYRRRPGGQRPEAAPEPPAGTQP